MQTELMDVAELCEAIKTAYYAGDETTARELCAELSLRIEHTSI